MPSDSVPSSRSARPVQETRIYVAGHRGMVGSALVRRLHAGGYAKLVLRTRAELDLLDQRAVREFMAAERPDSGSYLGDDDIVRFEDDHGRR